MSDSAGTTYPLGCGHINWSVCGHTAPGSCQQCFDEQAAELRELGGLLSGHMLDARKRWQDAHPNMRDKSVIDTNDSGYTPALNDLLEWLLGEMDRLAAELAELRCLFDLQQVRLHSPLMGRATERWDAAHPDRNRMIPPSFHQLLLWLLGEMDRLEVELKQRAGYGRTYTRPEFHLDPDEE